MTDSQPPNPQPSPRDPLGFDEFVGIFLSFTVIGSILFWALSRGGSGFDPDGFIAGFSDPIAATPSPVPTPIDPEPSPLPTSAAVVPAPRANVETPAPVPAPQRAVVPVPYTVPAPTAASPSPTPAPETINFSDVSADYWAFPFITALVERDIINGFPDGTFRPDAPVTRAEYAAMLEKAFDKPPQQANVKYKDVAADFWATDAIQTVSRNGFLAGYPNNIFNPTQQIPRAQVLVALVSGLGLPKPKVPTQQVLRNYQDAAQIPKYATDRIATATASGLVVSHPDQKQLEPNEKATRADTAAFIYQALVASGQAQPLQSPYVVQPPAQK